MDSFLAGVANAQGPTVSGGTTTTASGSPTALLSVGGVSSSCDLLKPPCNESRPDAAPANVDIGMPAPQSGNSAALPGNWLSDIGQWAAGKGGVAYVGTGGPSFGSFALSGG